MATTWDQAVVPLPVEFVPFNGQRGEFLVGNLDTGRVNVFIKLGLNLQACSRGRAADQIDHHLATDQGASPPVLGDVTEHAVLDLVPLAGAEWEVADLIGIFNRCAKSCNATFHKRERLALPPTPSAVIRSFVAAG